MHQDFSGQKEHEAHHIRMQFVADNVDHNTITLTCRAWHNSCYRHDCYYNKLSVTFVINKIYAALFDVRGHIFI